MPVRNFLGCVRGLPDSAYQQPQQLCVQYEVPTSLAPALAAADTAVGAAVGAVRVWLVGVPTDACPVTPAPPPCTVTCRQHLEAVCQHENMNEPESLQ